MIQQFKKKFKKKILQGLGEIQTTFVIKDLVLPMLSKIFNKGPNYGLLLFWSSNFNLNPNGYSTLILFHWVVTRGNPVYFL